MPVLNLKPAEEAEASVETVDKIKMHDSVVTPQAATSKASRTVSEKEKYIGTEQV